MSGYARMQVTCQCPLTQPCRCGDEHTVIPVRNTDGDLTGWYVPHDDDQEQPA